MSLLSSSKFYKSKTSVLVILRVQGDVNRIDVHVLYLAEVSLELLIPDVESQVTDDESALVLSSVFFWSVGILFHNFNLVD